MKTAHLVNRTYIVSIEELLERFNTENNQNLTREQLTAKSGHRNNLPDALPTGEVSIGTIQGHSPAFTTKYYTSPRNLI